MFVVLDEKAEQGLFQSARARSLPDAAPLLDLVATLNLEEELAVVCLPDEGSGYFGTRPGVPLPCYTSLVDADANPSYPAGARAPENQPLLLVGVTDAEPRSLKSFLFPSESAPPQACDTEVVRLETDLFSRLKGIFDTRVLASKRVCVIGVGSGGSLGAVELAKAGVGGFTLVDFDRLKAHNISRHVCGLADVGRFKTRAVRDAILQRNPQASVVCHEADVTEDGDLLDELAAGSDLVFVATDGELSRYLINDACLAAGTTAVYGGAYERAFAGEVVRVIPGEAGCYACVRQGLANTMRSISSRQVFDYTDDSELQAEPGLGLDVAFIAMIHTKLALMTLLRGTPSSLGDIDAQMIIWTNTPRPQDGELFQRALTRYLVRVPKSENCPACGAGPEGGAEEEGGVR